MKRKELEAKMRGLFDHHDTRIDGLEARENRQGQWLDGFTVALAGLASGRADPSFEAGYNEGTAVRASLTAAREQQTREQEPARGQWQLPPNSTPFVSGGDLLTHWEREAAKHDATTECLVERIQKARGRAMRAEQARDEAIERAENLERRIREGDHLREGIQRENRWAKRAELYEARAESAEHERDEFRGRLQDLLNALAGYRTIYPSGKKLHRLDVEVGRALAVLSKEEDAG